MCTDSLVRFWYLLTYTDYQLTTNWWMHCHFQTYTMVLMVLRTLCTITEETQHALFLVTQHVLWQLKKWLQLITKLPQTKNLLTYLPIFCIYKQKIFLIIYNCATFFFCWPKRKYTSSKLICTIQISNVANRYLSMNDICWQLFMFTMDICRVKLKLFNLSFAWYHIDW